MKILYAGLRHELYDVRRGLSFEYGNFYRTLARLPGVRVIEHPFDRILEGGKAKFNEELFALVQKEEPDLLFVFMYTDELDSAVLARVRSETKTLAWFADDYWRFWNYSRHYARYLDWVVTTYSRAVDWYRNAGIKNVILSQWAADPDLYKPCDIPKDIDVSFVGQYKPGRARLLRALMRGGIAVEAFGYGWPNGRVSPEEAIQIFSRSKINLNLTARPGLLSPRALARLFFKKSINRIVPDFHFVRNLRAYFHFPTPHTHARPFEIAACRGFVISGNSEDIGMCYRENEEMVFYRSLGELLRKTEYYLKHKDEREAIAARGYERTLREHTYEKRFRDIFQAIGLPLPS